MQVAFYKSTRPGLQGLYSRAVRLWQRGPYSHCEVIFSNGVAASSSFIDKGVRFKDIIFNPEHWDFIEIPSVLEDSILFWFIKHQGKPYDLRGNFGFVFRRISDDKNKWFCSEAIAAALGIEDSWRYCPNTLYSALSFAYPKNG